MELIVGNIYTGKELMDFLKETDNIVVVLSGEEMLKESRYKLENKFLQCSVHRKKEYLEYENNPFTQKKEVVGKKMKYNSKDFETTSIYIIK